MATSSYQTVGDIAAAVFRDTKESSNTLGIVDQVIRWCDEAQQQILSSKRRQWLEEQYQYQTIDKFQPTASISVTEASTSVNLGSGSPPAASLALMLKITGWNEVYNVDTISGLIATLSKPYLGETNSSAAGYIFQNSIALDAAIESVYQVRHAFQSSPLQALGPDDFFALQSTEPSRVGYATHYTLYEESDTGIKRMFFYPASDTAYTITVAAKKYVTELTALTQEPQLPLQFRQAIYWYAKFKMFEWHRNDAQMSLCSQAFNNWLMKINAEFQTTTQYPTLVVRYARPTRGPLFGLRGFDERLRDS